MMKQNNRALGIIFPNTYDSLVPELVNVRMMGSIPFASRYRMIDFVLSSMANSGIDNISLIATNNYHSLMDHLGSGREWDLVRKSGGLNIFPPNADRAFVTGSVGRVPLMANLIPWLKSQKEKYVILADANLAVNFNFRDMIKKHIESGADLTIAYKVEELPESVTAVERNDKGFYYTFDVAERGRIKKIFVNEHTKGLKNFDMNFYIIDRELFIKLINEGFVLGQQHFMRDIILNKLDDLIVQGYKFDGYIGRISGMKSYFDENMKLLEDENLDALFAPAPIHTKIRDDNPTRYVNGSEVTNSMLADGCIIEGKVENSVLFRGVKVGKGAVVKNCILMQDTVVEAGATVEYLITDKAVTISEGKSMRGEDTFPAYIPKGHTV